MLRSCRQQVLYQYEKIFGNKSGFTKGQKIRYAVQAAGVVLFFAIFFYRSLKAIPFMTPVGIFYLIKQEEKKRREKKARLQKEFKDTVLAVAANLRAGYAVENAFRETLQEMKILYGRESDIYRELYRIVQGMANNVNIEQLIEEFAQRTKVEEIREFADVFSIAKRSGGNLPEIMNETAAVISEKIEVEREIQVLLAEKKLEQNIMSVVPFAVVLYVGIASAGYFEPLYASFAGRAVMTVNLILYTAAYFLGNKVTEIEV